MSKNQIVSISAYSNVIVMSIPIKENENKNNYNYCASYMVYKGFLNDVLFDTFRTYFYCPSYLEKIKPFFQQYCKLYDLIYYCGSQLYSQNSFHRSLIERSNKKLYACLKRISSCIYKTQSISLQLSSELSYDLYYRQFHNVIMRNITDLVSFYDEMSKSVPFIEELLRFQGREQRKHAFSIHQKIVLYSWIYDHILDPYPDQNQFNHLSIITQIDVSRLRIWFINIRSREYASFRDEVEKALGVPIKVASHHSIISFLKQCPKPLKLISSFCYYGIVETELNL
ncbi:hypothetical protein WA158_002299 [Blastocystis sp. Blastoise]